MDTFISALKARVACVLGSPAVRAVETSTLPSLGGIIGIIRPPVAEAFGSFGIRLGFHVIGATSEAATRRKPELSLRLRWGHQAYLLASVYTAQRQGISSLHFSGWRRISYESYSKLSSIWYTRRCCRGNWRQRPCSCIPWKGGLVQTPKRRQGR